MMSLRARVGEQSACWLTAVVLACAFATTAEAQPLFAPPGSMLDARAFAPPPPIAGPPSADVLPLPADALPGSEVAMPTEDAHVPKVWLGTMPWETSVEFGLNGSSGTSDSLSLRAGGHVLRESRFSKLDLDSSYNRTTTGGADTQDNADLDVRNDWLLDEASPWTLYGTTNLFYDKFQSFDLQTSANTGVGYRFMHQPMLELIGRFGGGTSREFGGPDDRWVPESLLGVEYSQRLAARQRLSAKVDYYPEWEEIGEYRLLADAGWEIALDRPSNVCLKLSANDRFDSTSGGARPHLVNYSVLLLIRL